MAQIRRFFPAFVGGEEKIYQITHTMREEAGEESTPLDLTGYLISAEVWWEGCRRITLSDGHGLTIINLAPELAEEPAEQEPHYTITLNEQQTACVPLGRIAFVKLIRMSPSGVTTIRAPIWLNRAA